MKGKKLALYNVCVVLYFVPLFIICLQGCGVATKETQINDARTFCAPAKVKTIDLEEEEGNGELSFECADGRHSE